MADWCWLPSDLLRPVLKRLTAADHVRIGAVCRTWRSAALEEDLLPPFSKKPWLLHPGNEEEGNDTVFSFYRLSDNERVYKNKISDQLHGKGYVGSSNGWLVAMDERLQIYMLNPLSGAIIPLPPPATLPKFPKLEFLCDSKGRITSYHFLDPWPMVLETPEDFLDYYSNDYYFKKVILSSSNPKNCTVVAIHGNRRELAYARVGDDRWIVLEGVTACEDVILYKGQFYVVGSPCTSSDPPDMVVVAWDLSGPSPKMTPVASLNTENADLVMYLVESSGDLLLVLSDLDAPNDDLETHRRTSFHVYKLDERGAEWVEVKNIGDYALFLGYNCSRSLSSHEFQEIKGNCIYFTDDLIESSLEYPKQSHDLGVFHLEDGSTDPILPCASNLEWPAPFWFLPNLQPRWWDLPLHALSRFLGKERWHHLYVYQSRGSIGRFIRRGSLGERTN